MSGSNKQPPSTDVELAGIDLSSEPSNQEAIVLPYAAGQYTIAAHWISPAYNQRAVEAPSSQRGKK